MENQIQIGDGVHVCGWTDVTPYTVIEVAPNGKRIKIQADKATLLNGPDSGEEDALVCDVGGFCAHVSGVQRWQIDPDPHGSVLVASLRKDGRFYLTGSRTGTGKVVGVGRRKYYDFNF